MIDGKNVVDQPVKNNKITYENIKKISTSKGDDYTTGWLLDYIYFKNYYKMIVVDLSKQQVLDADPKRIQQIEKETQESISCLNKQRKLPQTFHKEKSFVSATWMNAIPISDLIVIGIK